MIKYLFAFTLMFLSCAVNAQSVPDTIKHSPIRTLTYAQYQAYLKGEAGDDLAFVATVHHYPMPEKVLRFKKELELSAEQISKLTDINTHMHKLRLQIGGSIIENEKTLDLMFAQNTVDNGNLIFYTNRHGLYQGELRNAILQACMATRKTLTPEQMNKFDTLQKPN
jgi:hypothetical protein